MPESHPLVCRFGALGDMILITPLLKQLYERSGLPCDLVAIGAWNHPLFMHMPWVREVITIDSRSAPFWLNRSQRELVRTLRSRDYRFVWVCETSRKSYRLLERAGISRANCANQLDLPPRDDEHYCDSWLRLGNVSPAGFEYPPRPDTQANTELFVTDEERDECRLWLRRRELDPERPLICIQAGSKRTTRRGRVDRDSNTKYWPEANWAAVIDALIERLPGAQLLLCGVPAELDMCRSIEVLCRQRHAVQAVADDLPLRRLLALLSIAHSCISVDTGPAHAAAALNCPLTVLFGKANPTRFRPVSSDSPVRVLQGRTSADSEPEISLISPRQVIEAWAGD
jgi:heptosyltransferase-2/heptosyltransferase-3